MVEFPLQSAPSLRAHCWSALDSGRQDLDAFRRQKMNIIDYRPQIPDWRIPYPDDWFFDDCGGMIKPAL